MSDKGLVEGSLVAEFLNAPNVLAFQLEDDGVFPNNKLPLLVYQAAFKLSSKNLAPIIERVFGLNKWPGDWRNGVYAYHHYHSTAHEVLGVFAGAATVQFGGDQGITRRIESGDVVVIPAGVAHKSIWSNDQFGVVGAYPEGQDWDLCYGYPGERPKTDQNIARVHRPELDPVYGAEGLLTQLWHDRTR